MKKKMRISLDKKIYSAEAVKLASYIFLAKTKISFKENKGKIDLEIASADAADGFLNEILNQQCRIDLAKKNSKVSNIIVTKALLSALGNRG